MTVDELFEGTMAVLSEDPADNAEFRARCPMLVNGLMLETYGVNQGLRTSKGLDPMTAPPEIASVGEEIPFEIELVSAFRYGLAEKYVFDENDFQKVGYFNSVYAARVNECWRGSRTLISDSY